MSTVCIVKNDRGKLEGFGQKGTKAYGRFLKAVKELEVGELLTFSFKVPRSPRFHRLHFAMLNALFAAQENFSDDLEFRKWTEVGAGHVKFVPGPKGRIVAMPLSIAYDALDDVEFSDLHEKVKEFMRSDHAHNFLWPHLEPQQRVEMVETILAEFEREQ
jgi:hypothetical protein